MFKDIAAKGARRRAEGTYIRHAVKMFGGLGKHIASIEIEMLAAHFKECIAISENRRVQETRTGGRTDRSARSRRKLLFFDTTWRTKTSPFPFSLLLCRRRERRGDQPTNAQGWVKRGFADFGLPMCE